MFKILANTKFIIILKFDWEYIYFIFYKLRAFVLNAKSLNQSLGITTL